MTSTLKVVCLIAVLLASLGATGARASPILTAEEMSTVKGGCLWCNNLDCAAGYPPECNGAPAATCDPGIPELACNVTKVAPITVRRCLNGANTYGPCRQGSLEGCGWKSQCNCVFHEDLKIWFCVPVPLGWNRHYYPCLSP